VAVEHYSPTVAKQWVDWLVDDLNSSIMRRDVAEAEQAIEYLSDQIKNTSVASLQNVFFNLIEEQLKTVMLAEVTDEYLFRTLDPAIAPDMKTKPKRSLIVILSALLGFFLAMAAVLLSTFWRQE
jgi:LPS O-antigen subunit length determinant protein (WzzB/FepE family)